MSTTRIRQLDATGGDSLAGRVVPALLLGLATAVASLPASASGLAPHRAVYEMTLERASTSSGIGELAGRMVYELTGAVCSGYAQTMRLVTRIVDREGATQVNDLRTTSFEAAGGEKLDFDIRQFRNAQLAEATEGEARRKLSGSGLHVRLKEPKAAKLDLSGDVMFPMQHSLRLLERARAGERSFLTQLYDGSEEGRRVYDTIAFIGARLSPDAIGAGLVKSLEGRETLVALPSWPVAMSYFEASGSHQDAIPSYELSFRFHDNGVTSSLVIDYGDFAIRGELSELTMLPATPCDGKKGAR